MVAAFLCVISGKDEQIKALAEYYLGRDLSILQKSLIGNKQICSFSISVKAQEDRTQMVSSLLGADKPFLATLVDTRDIGDLKNLFINPVDAKTTELILIPFKIQPQDDLKSHLDGLIRLSVDLILRGVYKLDRTSLEPLKNTWKDLCQTDQLDIEVAKKALIEGMSYVLPMLGVQKENAVVKESLDKWQALKIQDIEVSLQKPSAELKRKLVEIRAEIKKIISNLSKLLEGNSEESNQLQADLLKAAKVTIDQHGYRKQSISFELFQNADDAVVEWQEMSINLQPESLSPKFVVVTNHRRLMFIHTGRPIGCFRHPDNPKQEYRDRGYNHDLVKMLTFHISDKSENVTGKFGLGFKSIYLACARPYVLSKGLCFSVKGGLIPSRLEQEKGDALRKELEDYEMPSNATAFELELDDGVAPDDVIGDFRELVPILLVFSRAIKTCQFVSGRHRETLTRKSIEILGISGIEVEALKSGSQQSTLLCLRTDAGALLIKFLEQEGHLRCTIPAYAPTFWVTAPTQEKLSLGFVLNGDFDVTTGRESLVKSSKRNRVIADRIGEVIGKLLVKLFDANFLELKLALSITVADEYTFWNFLWQELAVSWQNLNTNDERRDLLRRMLGGDRGMGNLVLQRKVIPNGLYGSHKQLVDIYHVRYRVTGNLATEICFLQVVDWYSFQQYQGSLISCKRWEEAKQLLGKVLGDLPIADLKLLDVLKVEIGKLKPTVDCNKAKQLGHLISKNFLESLRDSEGEELQNFLQSVNFITLAGKPLPAKNLLLISSKDEEKRLAGFAPQNRLLHPEYTDSALNFFHACRVRRETIPIEELVQWAKAANTDLKKQDAVREYLVLGDQKQEFSRALKKYVAGTWMEKDEGIQKILSVNFQQEKVQQATEGKIPWSAVNNGNTEDDYKKKPEPKKPSQNEICQRISQINIWWQKNHVTEIEKYNACLYPTTVDKLVQGLRDRDRNAWMILLFLGAFHTMGRTSHEQHRSFIKFCMNRSPNWWEIFTQLKPQAHSDKWMSILEDYMSDQTEDTRWYVWVEKFPTFYRIARYLNDYIQSILSIESTPSISLKHLTAPRTNSLFSRGGPDAPPLRLGIGINFVLRELVRFGVLSPQKHIIQHCFVPRANVRRLLANLGCADLRNPDPRNSRVIYQFLEKRFPALNLTVLPTFENAFDIPFELVAEDSHRLSLKQFEEFNLDEIDVEEDSLYE